MNDFLTEMKQDMKEEQLRKWWETNRYFVYAAIVGTILITALYTWKNESDSAHAEEFSLLLDRASAVRMAPEERMKLLNKVVKEGPTSYQTIAMFQQAFTLVEQKSYDKAVTTLDAITNTVAFDQVFRDFAALRAIYVLTEYKKDDASINDRFTQLTSEQNIWRYTALELQAMHLLNLDKKTEALAVIQTLVSDENTPRFLQYRMEKIQKAIK